MARLGARRGLGGKKVDHFDRPSKKINWNNSRGRKGRELAMKRKTNLFLGTVCLMMVVGLNSTLAYEVKEVSEGAIISGKIGFLGLPPAPIRFEVKKNADVCGAERWLTKVAVQNNRLKGAVVLLQGVKKGKPFEAKEFKVNLPNEGKFRYEGGETLSLTVQTKSCNFGPYTGVLTSEELVRFENQDSVKHVLHSYAVRGRKAAILRSVHNRDIFPGSEIEVEFTKKHLNHSNVVAITCDRHDFMENRFYVVDNPYFSISDQDGKFMIDQVPPGRYELVVWHPVLGKKKQEITVEPHGNIELNFEFSKK